jgi:hypothetical protein
VPELRHTAWRMSPLWTGGRDRVDFLSLLHPRGPGQIVSSAKIGTQTLILTSES